MRLRGTLRPCRDRLFRGLSPPLWQLCFCMKDLQEKGETVDFDQLLQDIIQRDYNDSHREVAPLKQADDADYVDTTSMSIDDVVAHVKEVVHIKTKKADSTTILYLTQGNAEISLAALDI